MISALGLGNEGCAVSFALFHGIFILNGDLFGRATVKQIMVLAVANLAADVLYAVAATFRFFHDVPPH